MAKPRGVVARFLKGDSVAPATLRQMVGLHFWVGPGGDEMRRNEAAIRRALKKAMMDAALHKQAADDWRVMEQRRRSGK